jgi:hypothetical protein
MPVVSIPREHPVQDGGTPMNDSEQDLEDSSNGLHDVVS